MDKKYLDERIYTNTAQLLIGENHENSCSFCGAKWTIKSDGNLVWPPSNRKISIYCPMCGRHFVTKDLDDIMKEEKIHKLKGQLSTAGDRRDWDTCERIEKEIEELEGEFQ